ncbi:MAG: iron ABC transporter permease [Tannerellaceae bacterium]|jgi:iron complex transport system permease protein|nr:iron ABC transporter permease [Tannerellaceae bacterium]
MSQKTIQAYKKHVRRRMLFLFVLTVLLAAMSLLSLASGSADIHLSDIFRLLKGESSDFVYQIIWNIRLPRLIGGVLSGASLAIAGAVVQSLLRNLLASPYTLGISGAAAFGASFAIVVLGAGSAYAGSNDMAMVNNPYVVTLSAFIWSLAGVGVILLLSKYKGATSEMIILSGIIVSSLFGAGISAMQYFADNVQLASIVFWSFGDLGRASWENLLILSLLLLPILLFFGWHVWTYKAMQSGDEHAKSLGVRVQSVRLSGMLCAALLTAVVVSFYGVIAFVGLVVPHIIRRMIGSDEQFLLPASAVFGGFFLLLSDTLARTLISPVVLPVGILTSFVGAPLFLFLLIRGFAGKKNHIYFPKK